MNFNTMQVDVCGTSVEVPQDFFLPKLPDSPTAEMRVQAALHPLASRVSAATLEAVLASAYLQVKADWSASVSVDWMNNVDGFCLAPYVIDSAIHSLNKQPTCANCEGAYKDHVDGHCLFSPRNYAVAEWAQKPITEAVQRLEGKRPWHTLLTLESAVVDRMTPALADTVFTRELREKHPTLFNHAK